MDQRTDQPPQPEVAVHADEVEEQGVEQRGEHGDALMEQEPGQVPRGAGNLEQVLSPGSEDVLLQREAERLLEVDRSLHDRPGDEPGEQGGDELEGYVQEFLLDGGQAGGHRLTPCTQCIQRTWPCTSDRAWTRGAEDG